jgi:hypothetical protein
MMSDAIARNLASLARAQHRYSIRAEKRAVLYPDHAEQHLSEAGRLRRSSWRNLFYARQEKYAADEIRAREEARAAA